jgi:hypothetical protein
MEEVVAVTGVGAAMVEGAPPAAAAGVVLVAAAEVEDLAGPPRFPGRRARASAQHRAQLPGR